MHSSGMEYYHFFLQKEANAHCVEAKGSLFFQLTNDGDALKNNNEHHDFGMKFADRTFQCDNIFTLSLRKLLSRKSDKFSELVEKSCAEVMYKDISETLAFPVQDLATRKVVQ